MIWIVLIPFYTHRIRRLPKTQEIVDQEEEVWIFGGSTIHFEKMWRKLNYVETGTKSKVVDGIVVILMKKFVSDKN